MNSMAATQAQPLVVRLRAALTRLLGTRASSEGSLRLVETLHVGPKRQVLLVECDGERFLIAAGGDGMSSPVALRGGTRDAGGAV